MPTAIVVLMFNALDALALDVRLLLTPAYALLLRGLLYGELNPPDSLQKMQSHTNGVVVNLSYT
jgi:hypothetical protein